VRSWSPLIIGITGASSAGKTYSALRLATGIQRVIGGEIFGADTESDRMLHYADYFKFTHIPFPPKHGPQDYLALVDFIAAKVGSGRAVALLDSMSHEHDGDGGVLEQIEDFLEEKCGSDFGKRERMNFVAQIAPKRARKKLNRRIVALGNIVWILCYRAEEKIKPKKKGEGQQQGGKRDNEPENLGWQPITTSKLPFDMTARFLLTPGCDGVPLLLPPNPAEKLLVKNPRQFREWFVEGEPLSEEMGERLARWAMGQKVEQKAEPAQRAASAPAGNPPTAAEYQSCTDGQTYRLLQERFKSHWSSMSADQRAEVEVARKAAYDRLAAQASKSATPAPAEPAEEPAETWDIPTARTSLRECGDEGALKDLYSRIDAFYGGDVPAEVKDCRDECLDALNRL
jgi:hypothetical protein